MTRRKRNPLLLVQPLIDKRGDDPQFWKALREARDAFRTRDNVEEQDPVLGHASRFEHVNRQRGRTTWTRVVFQDIWSSAEKRGDAETRRRGLHESQVYHITNFLIRMKTEEMERFEISARAWPTGGKHRIQQQHPSLGNVLGQLDVEEARLGRLLVSLDEDLADANGAATIAEALLHSLAGAHDRDAADLALELDARVRPTDRGGDHVLDDGEVVEAFLDQEPDDAVRVKDEVRSRGSLVPDQTVLTGKTRTPTIPKRSIVEGVTSAQLQSSPVQSGSRKGAGTVLYP